MRGKGISITVLSISFMNVLWTSGEGKSAEDIGNNIHGAGEKKSGVHAADRGGPLQPPTLFFSTSIPHTTSNTSKLRSCSRVDNVSLTGLHANP